MNQTLNREEIILAVQDYCAMLMQRCEDWDAQDAEHIASILNRDADPVGLFRLMDEQTGSWQVGYRTRDGREWFPVLRQMRNTRDSGLLENLRG